MKQTLLLFSCFYFVAAAAQFSTYTDSIRSFQEKYVKEHDAVKGSDRKQIHFFPVNDRYRVTAKVNRIYEAPWFKMETSGKEKKVYRVYAILEFSVNDTICRLHVYQSQQLMGIKEYADHLFIPFTDLTTGEESYENGRYIDMLIDDLEGPAYTIDFNKAYNPYCAYISDVYNCPVPPKENELPVAIKAGEMKYGKLH